MKEKIEYTEAISKELVNFIESYKGEYVYRNNNYEVRVYSYTIEFINQMTIESLSYAEDVEIYNVAHPYIANKDNRLTAEFIENTTKQIEYKYKILLENRKCMYCKYYGELHGTYGWCLFEPIRNDSGQAGYIKPYEGFGCNNFKDK